MKPQLSKPLLYLMALTAGASVGNLFYCQPILPLLQNAFHVSTKAIGLVPTATQLGYALGILLVVPLGDMVSRRKLVITMMTLTSLSALAIFLSTNYWAFVAASAVFGTVTISTQILLPLSAQLSDNASRGRAMGIIISGMLIGILFARTISGWLASEFGWASVYLFATAFNGLLTLALFIMVPRTPVNYTGTYCDLMKSLFGLVKKYGTLRESMLFGALFFSAFNCFWATLDYLLLQPPFEYGSKTAGLFGLVGAAGALVAPLAGKLSDKGDPRRTLGIAIVLSIVAFALMWAGQHSLGVIILGTALMDMGVQAGYVTNQTRIYSLDPNSRSRFATIYVFAYFIGGAIGSSAGSWSFAQWNWAGPSIFSLAAFTLAGFVYSLGAHKLQSSAV